jgi:hypothetical protein
VTVALIALDSDCRRYVGAWIYAADGSMSAARGATSDLEFSHADGIARAIPRGRSWEDWCDALTRRTPFGIWWERLDVAAGTSAAALLDREISRQYN